MTRRLYYEDVYRKEFDAVVQRCTQAEQGWEIVLDASAFYPEGGGQSGDRGTLTLPDESPEEDDGREGRRILHVLDTQEVGEDIVLLCDGPAGEGVQVHGRIDWTWRFDRMQNHSGEHIVSGLIHARFGYNNVGFHMSADRMTIDLDGDIPEEALREIEAAANRVVWENRPVEIALYSEAEAEQVTYRSKKALHGEIRVVTIPGADACACCGTHVARTGEIGPIRILGHEKFHGGIRMELACGRWAYAHMTDIFLQNREVSVLLSSPPTATGQAVRKLLEGEAALKERLIALQYEQLARTADDLAGEGDVLLFAEDYTPQLLQKLTARVMEKRSGIVFAFSGSDETGYKYVIGQAGGDLRTLGKDLNSALSGRGGGRPYFLQGSVAASREKIETYITDTLGTTQVVNV